MACVFEEEALLAHAGGLHVSQTIEYEERPAILQDARSIINRRLRCRYVVLLGRRSVQPRTPSLIVSVEGSARTSFS